MKHREPKATWQPSTEQILEYPESAILATLDAVLELAIRTLRAEHLALGCDGRISNNPHYEPYIYEALPTAEVLAVDAGRLRGLIAHYRTVIFKPRRPTNPLPEQQR